MTVQEESDGVSGEESADDRPCEGGERLSKAEIFELLSAERRQEVLQYLDGADGRVSVGELAEHIASLECDCERAELSSQQRKRVYVGLYQCHLPKMANAGVIDYNADRGFVALNESSVRLLEYLYFEEDDERFSTDILNRFL